MLWVALLPPVPAAAPPTLPNIVKECSSTSDNNGYQLRLLQDGWIYIKEEDGDGYFHVFHYKQVRNGAAVIEQFEKYLFTNKVNAQGGLTLDTSSGRRYYPFAFVGRNTNNISIAYSHHEWSPNIIDKMNGDPAARTAAMQRLDLTSESDDYSVDATKESLEAFVEDYRQREKRVLGESQSSAHRGTRQMTLDGLTSVDSAYLVPDGVAAMLNQSTTEGRKGRLVALLDPVGRHIDLARTHSLLVLLEKQYDSQHIYPTTIGNITDRLLHAKNPEIKKAAEDNINVGSLNTYLDDVKKEKEKLQKRQAKIMKLFKGFTDGDQANQGVGDITTYMKYLVDTNPNDNDALLKEVQNLCTLIADLFEGITSSKQGQVAFEEMIKSAYKERSSDIDSSTKLFGIITKSLSALLDATQKVVTQAQENIYWDKEVAKALDRVLDRFGPSLGKMFAWSRHEAHFSHYKGELTKKIISHTTEQLTNPILKAMGIEYTPDTIKLTSQQVTEQLSAYIKKVNQTGDSSEISLKLSKQSNFTQSERFFDWGNTVETSQTEHIEWEVFEVRHTHTSGNFYTFLKHKTKSIGICADYGFTGLSAVGNASVITSFMIQSKSKYEDADPLKKESALMDMLSFTSAITALTVDIMTLSDKTVKGLQFGVVLK